MIKRRTIKEVETQIINLENEIDLLSDTSQVIYLREEEILKRRSMIKALQWDIRPDKSTLNNL